jgi:membrane protein required for colicin V production
LNFVDYIILGFLAIGFILGFRDGLVRKIIGVLGVIIGIGLAFEFSNNVAQYLAPLLNNEVYLAEIVSGFLIFLFTLLVFAIIKRVVHPFDKINKFINQLLGGIAGIVQIIFFISAFLLLLNVFNVPNKSTRESSLLYQKTYNVIPYSIELVMGTNSKAQNFIIDYIESQEE